MAPQPLRKRRAEHTERKRVVLKRSRASEEAVNPLQQLPDEVMLHILSHLSLRERLRASRVCKKWHQLAFDQDLWRRVDVSNRKLVTDAVLLQLTSYSQSVTELDITGQYNITSTGFIDVLKQCPRLVSLRADG